MTNKYPKDSPTPNWPKPDSLNVEHFSAYCWPVNQAIIDWLTLVWDEELKEKFLSTSRKQITNDELEKIKDAYSCQVDLIFMKSGY